MSGITQTVLSSTIFNVIGVCTAATILVKFSSLIRKYTRSSKLYKFAHPSQTGDSPWALVTGASDGIGRTLAEELAANGFNVIIHGRNSNKLAKVSSELQAAFPQRSFRFLVADANNVRCANCVKASQDDGSDKLAGVDFEAIKHEVEGLNLTVLINNVGGNPVDPIFMPLKDKGELKTTENISLNALFPIHLTRTLLPNLIQNAPALVINISTMTEDFLPLLATYGASKRFLLSIGNSIRLELAMEGKEDDVEILGVRTGRVTDVVGWKEPPTFFIPTAKRYAKAVLSHAGHGHGIVVGYWAHALQDVMSLLMPSKVKDKVIIDIMRRTKEWDDKAKKQL
ncbi:NAD(P)-binding protein [Daldinia caldariorum]|uniref:NAD(P)-binding protein n=1 Tax=Daldinia caldariorum TaxID=326644 RepID=UPI002008E4A4|nr:NAD(P)-binding protein [Daldinia caldariorum]KAI1466124.1 NAD(P)-binding protein [Daldinia caldariorum]